MNWCICPSCTHKLFRYEGLSPRGDTELHISIKCSSCKSIINITASETNFKASVSDFKTKVV